MKERNVYNQKEIKSQFKNKQEEENNNKEEITIFETSNLQKIKANFSKKTNDFYLLREELNGQNKDEKQMICQKYGILPAPTNKEILNNYLSENFGHRTKEEQKEKLDAIFKDLKITLKNIPSIVFGSYANGVTSNHSDLDFLIIIPQGELQVIEKLKNLKVKNKLLNYADKMNNYADLEEITHKGEGLSRLYTLSEAGIEVEFHIIGQKDAEKMGKVSAPEIKRLKKVKPKLEQRTSFDGEQRCIEKPANSVPNFLINEGKMFKGFFPDMIITGDLVGDKDKIAHNLQEKIYLAEVKAFLYYNKLILNTKSGYQVNYPKINFEDFLKTMFYSDKTRYSQDKLALMNIKFWIAIQIINKRFQKIEEKIK